MIANPLQSLYARQQLHPLVAAFRTAEINNLLIIATEMLRILSNCSASRNPSRIAVAGTVRVDVDCAWVKRHLIVHYMPNRENGEPPL